MELTDLIKNIINDNGKVSFEIDIVLSLRPIPNYHKQENIYKGIKRVPFNKCFVNSIYGTITNRIITYISSKL